MVYKHLSKSSQIKFQKFLHGRLQKQLQDTKLSQAALKKEVTDLTLEVEQTQDRLTVEGVHYDELSINYHSVVERRDALLEENKVLIDNWKWARDEIDYQREWRFEKSDKYEELYNEHIDVKMELEETKGELKKLDEKYMDLLKKYFED